MENKYIELLQKQIDKLEAQDFDLEAWKGSTIALLIKIYGKQEHRIEQISKLNVDLSSSWAMRDASPSYNPLKSAKQQGRELLQLTIDELQTLGLPEKQKDSYEEIIHEILEAELKGSQLKTLKKTLEQNGKDKQKSIQKLVKSWGTEINAEILVQLIKRLTV